VVSHRTAARRRWGLAALTACPLPGWRSRRLSTCRTAAHRTAAAQSIRRLWRCSRTQAAGLLDNHDDFGEASLPATCNGAVGAGVLKAWTISAQSRVS
jgi:hypothetical protein